MFKRHGLLQEGTDYFMTITKELMTKELKHLIKEFKEEIRDCKWRERIAKKNCDYAEANHLRSVWHALDYVIDRLESSS